MRERDEAAQLFDGDGAFRQIVGVRQAHVVAGTLAAIVDVVMGVPDLAARLGVRYDEIPIRPVFDAFLASLAGEFKGLPPDATEENLQARVRGTMLMALSNKFGCPPGEAVDLIVAAFKLGLVVEGLSFHVGSQCTNFENFVQALNAAAAGAVSVLGIDSSAEAVARATANASRNGLQQVQFLDRDVFEARALINLAKEKMVVTQMGTQIHATANYRRVVELVRGGAIASVGTRGSVAGSAASKMTRSKRSGFVPAP